MADGISPSASHPLIESSCSPLSESSLSPLPFYLSRGVSEANQSVVSLLLMRTLDGRPTLDTESLHQVFPLNKDLRLNYKLSLKPLIQPIIGTGNIAHLTGSGVVIPRLSRRVVGSLGMAKQ